jgi:hypothetical protein
VGGAGALPPKIGEAGSPTGGAPATVPRSLNPFNRVKVIQMVLIHFKQISNPFKFDRSIQNFTGLKKFEIKYCFEGF